MHGSSRFCAREVHGIQAWLVTGDAKRCAIAIALWIGLACDPGSAPSAADDEPIDDAGQVGDAGQAGDASRADADERDDASRAAAADERDDSSRAVAADERDDGADADDAANDPELALDDADADTAAAGAPTTAGAPPSDLARAGAPGAPIPVETPPSLTAPIDRRRTTRATMIYVEPRFGSPFRGKLPDGEAFDVYELVPAGDDDDECRRDGWGRIDAAAYVCLRHTEPTEDEPAVIPARLADGLAPFFYARRRGKEGNPDRPEVPVYRSRAAMRAGAPPERFLSVEHDYIFVERKRARGGAILMTPDRRVVRERDVRRLEPSKFAGRDVRARPVATGGVMAWSVQWPHAAILAEPHPEAAEVGRLPLHAEALAHGELRERAGETWVSMLEPAQGWALADHVRHWVDHRPPTEVRDDELWIDVDLDQQMLALRRGRAVEFLTLISSGTSKHPTPLGLYRLEGKWAHADMRSREGDAEEYFVEGVPWVQYFKGRYALHGTFWHNRFGRRTSHGCINLSAHDARWVYERTWPAPKPGWLVINEHPQDPGTLLRIRKGQHDPPDRRDPLKTGR
jgi:hypothetical protein